MTTDAGDEQVARRITELHQVQGQLRRLGVGPDNEPAPVPPERKTKARKKNKAARKARRRK